MRIYYHIMPMILGLLASILLLSGGQGVSAAEQPNKPLVFAVYAYLDDASVRAEYQPLIDYLNRQLGANRVVLQVLDMAAFNDAIRDRTIDIATTNPTHYLQLRHAFELTGVIATTMRKGDKDSVSVLSGVIFSKNNRHDINRLSDLQNKSIAIANKHHLGGFWAQQYTLYRAGVALDEAQLLLFGEHIKVVKAVLEGKADVGFVRSGLLETMQDRGMLASNELKIINAQYSPYSKQKMSTESYPEWPIFAPTQTPEKIQALVLALLAYRPAIEQIESGGISGFTFPSDYSKVESLARELRLPPFDRAPSFNLVDAWQKWQDKLLFIGSLLALLLLLLIGMILLYRAAQVARYRNALLLSSLGEGVFGVDKDERCTFMNAVALEMLGAREALVLGRHVHALFHHHHDDGRAFSFQECPVSQTLTDGKTRTAETHLIRANGSIFPAHLTVAPMLDAGKIIGAEVIFQDISQQKETEARLYQLANFDALTGCANRRYFVEQLSTHFELGKAPMVLMMLDLDHFKQINDRYGHAVGDAVLQAFSHVLQDQQRSDDLVGRIGGEEFAVLLPNTTLTQAKVWAESLRKAVEKIAIAHAEQQVGVTVSIGVAEFDLSLATIDDWLLKADKAVYRAKDCGRNQVVVS
jgi:diguanylate cyclase (GGDEF)-like protein/PAS domain S-box-containing protein